MSWGGQGKIGSLFRAAVLGALLCVAAAAQAQPFAYVLVQ
jgi:hypothetical protein